MKKFLIVLPVLILLSCNGILAQADQRTISTRIADILAKVPAPDSVQFAMVMHEMAGLGKKGVVDMASTLAAPGKGDNTKPEYALGSFSYYTTKPGNESLKAWCADAYAEALAKASDKENKAFFIRQLEITGGNESVGTLKTYLTDERLSDPAARALIRIHTPEANQALLDALQNASGNNRLTLVEALGDCRYAPANKTIASLADAQQDQPLRKLALYALAKIADPSSSSLLADAAAKSRFTYEPTDATSDYLEYASRLAAINHQADAEKIALDLLKKCASDEQVHTRSAALKLLADMGGEKSVPQLIAATNDQNFKYRKAALRYAEKFVSDASTALWIKQLNKVQPPVKAEIVTMLGNARATAALSTVLRLLQDKNEKLSLAAIKAAGQIGQQSALSPLLNVLKKADTAQAAAVANALLVMKGDDVAKEAGKALPSMSSPQSISALINVLAARSAHESTAAILSFTKNSDTLVRNTSYRALKYLATRQDLPQLFDLLNKAQDSMEIRSVQDAVIAGAKNMTDSSARVSMIVSEMNKSNSKQPLFFPILAGVGGKASMNMLMRAFDNGDAQVKEAVVKSLSASSDAAALSPLLQVSRKSAGSAYFNQALEGYVRLAGHLENPEDEQLLLLRDAVAIAQTNDQKESILEQIGNVKTFPALVFAGNYLDDAALQQEAADAVMKIALARKDLFGAQVRALLEKAMPLLKGSDADYQRQAIRKHLAEMPEGEGFVSMFNGKDLTGWKGLVANPIERAKMDPKTLEKEQQKADARMRTGWYAKNGELVFSGNGDNLCTVKKYGDFDMFVDWKITSQGDAGIYLRGTPQVQIWDTSRVDVGAQVGSGGLYNNQKNESKPLKLADNAIGEWNTFHIIMKGERVTVFLNGVKVVDSVPLENYWDHNLPIFPEEQIELQAHGTYVAYRNLYIREISRPKPFELSNEEKKAGFKVLFDGTNMNEWIGNKTEYVLEDGNIVVRPQHGEHGNLFTKDEYSDFVYRFEFQLTPGANNGIGIRAPLEGDAAYVGMEIQVLDNDADIYKDLHEYQYHGSVYGVIPAKRGYLKPLGEWNSEEITAKGNGIKVVLNGTTILDGDIAEASKNGTLDGKDHPGLKRKTGHIGFLGHGDVVKFRNIRIKY